MANDVMPRPFHEWNEAYGDVIWWLWPIEEAPYVGSPLDCGHTVEMEINAAASDGHKERGKMRMDVGGWPWRDADEETEARLFWTELPDATDLDQAIRDHIRGGPDPFKELAAQHEADLGAIAIDMVIASLSPAQVQFLNSLRPHGDGWAYPVKVRGDGLQTSMALAKRGIVSGDNPRPFQNNGRGFIRLTPFGQGLREIIVGRAAA